MKKHKQQQQSPTPAHLQFQDILSVEMNEIYNRMVDARREERYEDFFALAEEMKRTGEETKEPACKAEVLFQMAKYHEHFHRYGQALTLLKESFSLYSQRNIPSNIAMVASNIATTYLALRLFQESVEYSRIALQHATLVNAHRTAAVALANMGNCFMQLNQPEQALQYILESIPFAEKCGDNAHINYVYLLLGNVYQHQGNYELSLEQYHYSLSLREQLGRPQAIAVALNNIANTLVKMNRHEEALSYFHRSLKYKEGQENLPSQFNTLTGIATCYAALGNIEEAFATAGRVLSIAETTGLHIHLSRVHELLAKLHEESGNTTESLLHYKKYHHHYVQDVDSGSRSRYEELAIAFELDRKEQQAEIERLRTEQLRKEVEHKNKELASLALHLAQKNEMLAKLKERLEDMRTSGTEKSLTLNTIESDIRSSLSGDKSWQLFEQQFKTIHHDFVQRLTRQCGDLSPTELRLCALLKINLSSKEIANILCIAPKSIEMYRFRVRKKLRLKKTENLNTYLAGL